MPSEPSTAGNLGRFDPLKLLSEIQAEQPTTSISARPLEDEDEVEDDFMSNKYLETTETKQPLTYTDKRRKLEAHHPRRDTRSLKQREEEAREEGLDRDLLAEAEIVAGGGKLPPEGKDGSRRWELMEQREGGDEPFKEAGRVEAGKEEDGTAKAMRMMLAMGYRRGEALGKRMADQTAQEEDGEVEEDTDEEKAANVIAATGNASPPYGSDPASFDTDEEQAAEKDRADSQAREEDEYLTGGVSSAPFSANTSSASSAHNTAPLRPDQRWLGLNRRAGIGMIPKTSTAVAEAIRAKASSNDSATTRTAQAEAALDYRARISKEHQERHNQNLLSRARKTLMELDRAAGTVYSPLWLDSNLYHILSGHTALPAMDATTIDERMQRDAEFKEAVELLQSAFSAEDKAQVQEAETFCNLEVKEQLGLVLLSLRQQHHYCLFCGCQYGNAEDLAANCPGEAEDDHD